MIISSFEGVQLLDHRLLIWDNDQVHGKIEIIENDLNESLIQMAPSVVKKDSNQRFIVMLCVPGLTPTSTNAELLPVQKKPVLRFCVEMMPQPTACDGVSFNYDLFEQDVLLPDDVRIETFSKHFGPGMLVCSFEKKKAMV